MQKSRFGTSVNGQDLPIQNRIRSYNFVSILICSSTIILGHLGLSLLLEVLLVVAMVEYR